MNFLNDNYVESGNDIQEFREKLKHLEENTVFETKKLSGLKLLSYQDFGGSEVMVELDPKKTFKKNKKSITFKTMPYKKDYLINQGYDEGICAEAEKTGIFLGTLKRPEEIVPVSEYAIQSMSQRARMGGALDKKLSRDIAFCENFNSDTNVQVIKRKEDNCQKVFAVMSSDYKKIPQSLFLSLQERIEKDFGDFGHMECSGWEIRHDITRISFIFPDMKEEYFDTYGVEDAVPGILIETSDIGMCSFRLSGFIEIKGVRVYTKDEYNKIHTGSIDTEEILSSAKTKILPEITYYPQRLAELMTVNITDPSMSYFEKREALEYACENIIKLTGIKKILGKKRAKDLLSYLTDSYYPDTVNFSEISKTEITAFTVAEMFLSLPERLENVPDSVTEAISSVLWRIFDYDYAPEEKLCVA